MKKFVGFFGLLMLLAVPAMAQDTSTSSSAPPPDQPAKAKPAQQTPQVELSGGFSYRRFQDIDGDKLGMKGWYFSAEYNVFRWLGGVAEVSDTRQNQYLNGNTGVSNVLIGPQVFPFGHRKVTVFGEFLVGVGLYRNSIPAFGDYPASEPTYAAFMWQGGGGVEYNRWKHLGIRLIQADFGHVSFFPNSLDNHITSRYSVGLVYRFGEK